jgi:hypothetical protein
VFLAKKNFFTCSTKKLFTIVVKKNGRTIKIFPSSSFDVVGSEIWDPGWIKIKNQHRDP